MACASNTTGSTCGGAHHRSRTPLNVETSAEDGTIVLDASVLKNWHVNLNHASTTVTLSNVVSGRRGHIVLENKLALPATISFGNSNNLFLVPGGLTVTTTDGVSSIPVTTAVVLRYYGDLVRTVVVLEDVMASA